MKAKNKVLSIILIAILLLTSGCGKNDYLVDNEGRMITNSETGQSVRKDILCKPQENSELYRIYEEHNDELDVKLEDLPTCKDFSLTTNKYKGLWQLLLVRPIALVILKFGFLVNNFGISVMVVGLLIRLIMLPLSLKSMRQSQTLQKAQPEIARIEKKYANKTDNASMMAKSQEMMMVYQKYKINPVSGCLGALLQIPLFFAFLDAINKVPAIFEGSLFGMQLGTTPWKGISQGQYIYIILIFLIIVTTYASFKNSMNSTSSGNDEMMKQMSFMFKFMIISISIASFNLPTAIAFYWIVTNGFAVVQNYIIKKILANEKHKEHKIFNIKVKNKKERR